MSQVIPAGMTNPLGSRGLYTCGHRVLEGNAVCLVWWGRGDAGQEDALSAPVVPPALW